MLDINIKVILRLMTYNYLYGPHVQLSHVDAELSHTQVVLPVDDVLPPAPPPPPLPQPDRITRSMKQNKTLLSTFPSPPNVLTVKLGYHTVAWSKFLNWCIAMRTGFSWNGFALFI